MNRYTIPCTSEYDKKMLELVDFINCILDSNKCSEDIYTILSYMCRNGYFSNWEFKDEDIFIDGQQITKNGIFVKSGEVTEKLSNEYVDLSLPSGTLWAKCNIGAEKETDYGDYFTWGSTVPNTDMPCDWTHAPFNNVLSSPNKTYFNAHKSEWLDENDVLKPEYDAAHVIMGGNWRMPIIADFEELLKGTTNEWVENYKDSGVNGILFTSKTNSNTMFFPAAGYRDSFSLNYQGYFGNVWSSELRIDNHDDAWTLYFDSDNCGMDFDERYYGFSVRGVMNLRKN